MSGIYEWVTIPDLRWQCPSCSRFILRSAIREEDFPDPGAYFGVGTRTWIDCPRCGTLEREPRLVKVGEVAIQESRP